MDGWISVEERLPECGERVAVKWKIGDSEIVEEMYMNLDGRWPWVRLGGEVTHWMPLPPPPEG